MEMEQHIPHSRPWITEKDKLAVQAALHSGMISEGSLVSEFENEVKRYLSVNNAVAQGSGTAALILALKTLDIKQGDEVVLPTYVCRSVLEAILSVGASASLCDVDEKGVITVNTVTPLITEYTKAIIAVHTFGHPCDIAQLKTLGFPVIEDACQSLGLLVDGIMAGAMGDVGILSFHATKCLASGEGGMLVTDDTQVGERARKLAAGDLPPAPRSVAPMSDLQAALGIAQFARYSEFISRRAELCAQYTNAAHDLGFSIGSDLRSNMLFRFTLRIKAGFGAVEEQFSRQGVTIRRGVDELLHRLVGLDDVLFPHASHLYQQTVSVPFYPGLSQEEAAQVKDSFASLKNVDRD